MPGRDSIPVAIAVAPNGARRSRDDHPMLPTTPEQLAQCAADCLAAGAAMLHLHVRDTQERHSLDPDNYRAAIAAIRARIGDEMILQITTESGGRYAPPEQMACAEALAPEAVSLAIRELFRDPANEVAAGEFLSRIAARGTLVQYIVYTPDDLAHCARLQVAGLVPQVRPQVLFVLGSYAEQRAGSPIDLLPMLAALPAGWPWSICAFGPDELQCAAAAALLGGQVRVGFENNMLLPSGAAAADNAELVRATVAALAPLGMRPATCAEARSLYRDARD